MLASPIRQRILSIAKHAPMFWEFLLVILLIAAANYATIPSALVVVPAVKADHALQVQKSDFIIFHSAGRIACGRHPDKIYDEELQKKSQAQDIGFTEDTLTPYLYPPQSLLFFAPFASLPLHDAYVLWHGINAVFSFLLLVALYCAGICNKRGVLVLAAILLVSCNIWIIIMANGQPTILMALGLLGCQLCAKHKHMAFAALLLLFTAFKPQLLLAPTLYLLMIYGWALWLSVALVALAVAAICCAFFGLSIWYSYFESITAVQYKFHDAVMQMCNVRTLVLVELGENHLGLINAVSECLWAGSLFIAAVVAVHARRGGEDKKELGFSLIVAVACLFSPYLFLNSLILLIIPVGYVMKYSGFRALYVLIGALIILNWIGLHFPAESNPLVWVPVQMTIIAWLTHRFLQKSVPSLSG